MSRAMFKYFLRSLSSRPMPNDQLSLATSYAESWLNNFLLTSYALKASLMSCLILLVLVVAGGPCCLPWLSRFEIFEASAPGPSADILRNAKTVGVTSTLRLFVRTYLG